MKITKLCVALATVLALAFPFASSAIAGPRVETSKVACAAFVYVVENADGLTKNQLVRKLKVVAATAKYGTARVRRAARALVIAVQYGSSSDIRSASLRMLRACNSLY